MTEGISLVLTLFLGLSFVTVSAFNEGLDITIVSDGNYTIGVNYTTWLSSGSMVFNNAGKRYSTADNTLKLLNFTGDDGTDRFGQWESFHWLYQAGDLKVDTSVKTYDIPDLPLAIFTQKYLTAASGTSVGEAQTVISQFPTFSFEQEDADLGFMAFGDDMAGWDGLTFSRWEPFAFVPTGIKGGPIVIFDNASNALVISPLSQFMAASSALDPAHQVSYGVMGGVDNVPANYTIDFIIYYSAKGINQAMKGWGQFLQKYYGKTSERREKDLMVQYMGYWTDNGAYYYYLTEKGKNYQETIVDVTINFTELGVPFKYLQYDSWWYTRGHRDGTKTWAARKDIFPDGFQYLANKTQLPFACHNRYWDSDTTYAKYNGGKYTFIADKFFGLAVPDDKQFWIDLLNETQKWGNFILYEQDWLNWQTDQVAALTEDLYLGRRWLMDMGEAAQMFKVINIQYCMAYSRHLLQSVEIPVVTQVRVSEDYSPGGRQWNIGITSIFADALNLAPYKDTHWTTENQPGNRYQGSEPYTRLNNLISTLSTGPVGPGDGIGFINKTLLMRCCDVTGLILKPAKPATAIDDQIKRLAFGTAPGPDGELYTTYTQISEFVFGIALAVDLKTDYSLTPTAGWAEPYLIDAYVYSGTDDRAVPVPFTDIKPLHLGPACTAADFCLYYTSPVLPLGDKDQIILMGERDKWVPMSQKRFLEIQVDREDTTVKLIVQGKEKVIFTYMIASKNKVQAVVCDNSQNEAPARNSYISIAKGKCVLVS